MQKRFCVPAEAKRHRPRLFICNDLKLIKSAKLYFMIVEVEGATKFPVPRTYTVVAGGLRMHMMDLSGGILTV